MIERAAGVYAELLPRLAAGPSLLDLVPGPVGRGELDARLGRASFGLLTAQDVDLGDPDLPDLDLASEEVPGGVETTGERLAVPEIVRYLDGSIHAATPAGLACALAWAASRWQARHALTALLTSPDETPHVLASRRRPRG